MRVIYKEPGKEPRTMVIPNELKVLQDLVGGYIETLKIADNVVMIFNEEGKLLDLAPNFFVGAIADVILGPVIIVGEDGDEFTSLSEDNIAFISGILRGGFDI